jgi:hypothetical protein
MEQLLKPEEAARLLNMSVQFVRDHSSELGVIRMGGGNQRAGRLRFIRERIEQYANARRPNEKATRPQPKRMAG